MEVSRGGFVSLIFKVFIGFPNGLKVFESPGTLLGTA